MSGRAAYHFGPRAQCEQSNNSLLFFLWFLILYGCCYSIFLVACWYNKTGCSQNKTNKQKIKYTNHWKARKLSLWGVSQRSPIRRGKSSELKSNSVSNEACVIRLKYIYTFMKCKLGSRSVHKLNSQRDSKMMSFYYIGKFNLSTSSSQNTYTAFWAFWIHLLVLVFGPMKDISGDHILYVNANKWSNLMVWSLYLNKFVLSWLNFIPHNADKSYFY